MDAVLELERHAQRNAIMMDELLRRKPTPEVLAQIERLKPLLLQHATKQTGPHHRRREQEMAAHQLAVELEPEARMMVMLNQPSATEVPA